MNEFNNIIFDLDGTIFKTDTVFIEALCQVCLAREEVVSMKKIKELEIDKMREYVINALVANYHYDYEKAKSAVVNSAFNRMLVEDTDYVFHYTVGYWVDEVNNEVCSVFM